MRRESIHVTTKKSTKHKKAGNGVNKGEKNSKIYIKQIKNDRNTYFLINILLF